MFFFVYVMNEVGTGVLSSGEMDHSKFCEQFLASYQEEIKRRVCELRYGYNKIAVIGIVKLSISAKIQVTIETACTD